jgi:DNA-binding transcriptional ArsR family regulator
MIETVTRVCRAMASPPRLRILYHLALEPELPATEAVRRAALVQPRGSSHLRVLETTGLIRHRRSGARVYYALPEGEPEHTGFPPLELLRRAFDDPGWATQRWPEATFLHLSPDAVRRVPEEIGRLFDIVFDAATAFASVRRLQILRLLTQRGACRNAEITSELKISPPARVRHLDKLERRGYVRERRPGTWALRRRAKTPFHAGLLSRITPHLR